MKDNLKFWKIESGAFGGVIFGLFIILLVALIAPWFYELFPKYYDLVKSILR